MAKKSQPAMRVSQASVARDEAAKIKALSAALGLGKPLPIAKKKVYVGGMNISDDFLESTAQIFDDLGKETGTTSFDSNAARTAIAFRKSQGPVLAAAQALVSLIEERIVSTYGGAGHSALQLYAKLKLQARELEASDAV